MSARIIDLARYRSKRTPVTVFCSLADVGRESILEHWRRSYARGPVTRLSDRSLSGQNNDCSECDTRERLADQLRALLSHSSRSGNSTGEIWLEASPDCSSGLVADFFTHLEDDAPDLAPKIELLRLVSVIDCSNFWQILTAESRSDDPESELQSAENIDLLLDLIEVTDAIVLTGTEKVPAAELMAILSTLRLLQPRAWIGTQDDIHETTRIPLFKGVETLDAATWRQAITGSAPNISMVYRRKRPFHPERLYALISEWPEAILRSAGQIWIASQPDEAHTLSQIGPASIHFSPDGKWIACLPAAEQAWARRNNPELNQIWDPTYGDRCTEIAFIGEGIPVEEWTAKLDACLLTDLEMRRSWRDFKDPFPRLATEDKQHPEEPSLPIRGDRPALRLVTIDPPTL